MHLLTRLYRFIPLLVIITGLSGAVYLVAQQSYRQGADDPQIQMAEDAAFSLASGTIPSSLIDSSAHIAIAESLAPYLVVYSEEGNPVTGTGFLDGVLPQLPSGVFSYAREHQENRVTWQPRSGVRSAIVLVHYDTDGRSGFVLAGRSLREVEIRENELFLQVSAMWLITVLVTFVSVLLFA